MRRRARRAPGWPSPAVDSGRLLRPGPALLTTLLARRRPGRRADTAWAMEQVMLGEATPAQIAGFVVALRAKGESPDEVAGLVRAMLDDADAGSRWPDPAVDACGTGGDRAHTVNISTMSAMVVAGAGARVVKHGNRAASSACGSADLLEELGVVDRPRARLRSPTAWSAPGSTFCFAPEFHPALRHAAVPRRELGVPTVFNFLGPLANPAQPSAQAVGVADPRMAGVMAQVLADRGACGAGVPRRRRPRRAHTDHHLAGLGRPRRRGHDGAARSRGRRAGAGRAGLAARRRPDAQRRGHPAVPGRRGWRGA